MIFAKKNITYVWLKSKIYLKKVLVMTNNKLALANSFRKNHNLQTFILKNLVDNICSPHKKRI